MKFENMVINVGGAANYIPKANAKMRRIKELYQGVKADLPWNLSPTMAKDLVAYCMVQIIIW
jgi:hypothetical protein